MALHSELRDRYKWQQGPDNTWTREADEVESFYAIFSRKRNDPEKAGFPIMASTSFQLDGTTSSLTIEATLRKAWIALRGECPTLASSVGFDSEASKWRRVYRSLPEGDASAALDTWAADTFRTVKTDLSPGAWFNTSPPTLPSPVLYLVLPESDDIARGAVSLRCPHDLIDGHGLLQLVNRLFEIASALHGGELVHDLSHHKEDISLLAPPMRVAVDIAPQLSPDQQGRYDAVKMKAIMSQMQLPPLGLPMDMASLVGGNTGVKRVASVLPAATSDALLKKCKEQGLTATHVLSAGLVLALRDLQKTEHGEGEKTLRYHTQALVSLRDFFLAGEATVPSGIAMAAGNHHALATTGLSRDFTIGAKNADQEQKQDGDEFMSLAREFRDYYVSVKPGKEKGEISEAGRDILDFAPHTWDMYTPKPPPTPLKSKAADADAPPADVPPTDAPPAEPAAPPKLPTSAPVAVSSIGNISSVIQADRSPFKLTGAWIAAEGMGPSIPVLVQTWEGRVGVSACFEAMFHDGAYIQEFLGKILQTTLDGMAVKQEGDLLSDW